MLAKQFIRENTPDNLTFEQCFLVYKFTQTQFEVVVSGLVSMAQTQTFVAVTAFYRKLIKLLHPDKNSHPLAKEAF